MSISCLKVESTTQNLLRSAPGGSALNILDIRLQFT